nr:1539_t:CDS:10 [Entrophospora candida]
MTTVNRSHQQSVGNYIVGNEIGRGSFATVYKGYHKKTKENVAIKSVSRSKLTKKLLENLESEIKILKRIHHDHIVQLVDCEKSESHIHLIMEYCTMGDLSQYIKQRGANNHSSSKGPSVGLSEYVVRHFLKQLANALEFLRSQNLIHQPKQKNFGSVVGSPDLPILKIADFGFARSLPSSSLAETLCGSPLYMAPEILRYEKYDAKADLWSVGAVIYEISVGKPPFRAQNHVELLKRIEKGGDKIKFPSKNPGVAIHSANTHDDNLPATSPTNSTSLISEELKDLIRHLLKRNPVERISFEEFFMHPCVVGDLIPQPLTNSFDPKEKPGDNLKPNRITNTPSTNNYYASNQSQKNSFKDNSNNAKYQQILQRSPKSPNIDKMFERSKDNNNNNNEFLQVNNEVQPSYDNRSPSPSLLVQTPYPQDELVKRQNTDAENFEHSNRSNSAEDDVQFAREYVLIEKRAVEVNKLADDLAVIPKSNGSSQRPFHKGTAFAFSDALPSKPLDFPYKTSPNQNSFFYSTTPPFAIPQSSQDKSSPVGSIGSSASSALARALNVASVRLFGTGNSPPSWSDKYSKQKGNSALLTNDVILDPEEEAVIKAIEEYAQKAHFVHQFADSKINQLLPPPPTSSNELAYNSPPTPQAAITLAEEAFVLYVKALSILQAAIVCAKDYLSKSNEKEDLFKKNAHPKLNTAVQWVRARFNECLEKAEYAESRFLANGEMTTEVVVEKLLYDKALEMSRHAAVNELINEDLLGCEKAYKTSIHMLNAILEGSPDEVGMGDDDKKVINKFIKSINKRLDSLQKKLAQSDNNLSLTNGQYQMLSGLKQSEASI